MDEFFCPKVGPFWTSFSRNRLRVGLLHAAAGRAERVIAVDIAPAAIERARVQTSGAANVDLRVANIMDIMTANWNNLGMNGNWIRLSHKSVSPGTWFNSG